MFSSTKSTRTFFETEATVQDKDCSTAQPHKILYFKFYLAQESCIQLHIVKHLTYDCVISTTILSEGLEPHTEDTITISLHTY